MGFGDITKKKTVEITKQENFEIPTVPNTKNQELSEIEYEPEYQNVGLGIVIIAITIIIGIIYFGFKFGIF